MNATIRVALFVPTNLGKHIVGCCPEFENSKEADRPGGRGADRREQKGPRVEMKGRELGRECGRAGDGKAESKFNASS